MSRFRYDATKADGSSYQERIDGIIPTDLERLGTLDTRRLLVETGNRQPHMIGNLSDLYFLHSQDCGAAPWRANDSLLLSLTG